MVFRWFGFLLARNVVNVVAVNQGFVWVEQSEIDAMALEMGLSQSHLRSVLLDRLAQIGV